MRNDAARLLVVAHHPFQLDEAGFGDRVEVVGLIRRPQSITTEIERAEPDVILVDTTFVDDRGIGAIESALATDSSVRVLALTSDPPPHRDVARATRAGAVGFVDVNADADEMLEAIECVYNGGLWFPPGETRSLLTSAARHFDTTAEGRRSQLVGILLGVIPLAGAVSAVLSLLWRQYLGQIGVRPVDLAVDPGTRVIDVFIAFMAVIGIFGPVLFVNRWLDLIQSSGAAAWLLRRPALTKVVLSAALVLVGSALYWYAPLVATLLVGPLVLVAIVAGAFDLAEELPAAFRLDLSAGQLLIGALVTVTIFLAALSYEVLVIGPDLQGDGAEGVIGPTVLGFRAQPVLAFDTESDGPGRELLYLGGNADLYVLVDPCKDDEVSFISVGATRLVVIDEVTCADEVDG